jgi:hypothetical protein
MKKVTIAQLCDVSLKANIVKFNSGLESAQNDQRYAKMLNEVDLKAECLNFAVFDVKYAEREKIVKLLSMENIELDLERRIEKPGRSRDRKERRDVSADQFRFKIEAKRPLWAVKN